VELGAIVNFAEAWKIQRRQQLNWGNLPADTPCDVKERKSEEYLLGLYEELGELARYLRRRTHVLKGGTTKQPLALAEHAADVFKYLTALLDLNGVDASTFGLALARKTVVVQQKWAWEKAEMEGRKVLVVDLDGCVCDWVVGFRAYARKHNVAIPSGGLQDPALEWLKDAFDSRGGFLDLKPLPGAVLALELLNARGWTIVIVTARPYIQHPRVYADTLYWLKSYGVPYHHIFFDRDKARAVAQLAPAKVGACVEDRMKHALELALAGHLVLKMPSEGDDVVRHKRIRPVVGWEQILKEIGEEVTGRKSANEGGGGNV